MVLQRLGGGRDLVSPCREDRRMMRRLLKTLIVLSPEGASVSVKTGLEVHEGFDCQVPHIYWDHPH